MAVCPFFVCPLCHLEVATGSSFCVVFKGHSFFLSDFEVMNGHGVGKKEFNNKWESKNYSGGGKESNYITI